MMHAALLLATVLTAAAPSDEILKQYRTAAATVGHAPEANLKLALWCEQNGLEPEREKHLAMVIVADPDNAVARGLLGQVREDGKWQTPAAVAERIKGDPAAVGALNEHAARRAKSENTAESHWKLALWCEKNSLPAEATAHLINVLHCDPNNAAARLRLGYKKLRNGWYTDKQIVEAKAEAAAQEKADRRWKSTLEALQNDLRHSSKRDVAERQLAGISNPRAVPSILRIFGSRDQRRTLQLLGQIDSPASARAIALLAVFGRDADQRRAATETLRLRDPREYADLLISMLRDPIHYEVKPVEGPGSTGELVIEGKEFDRKRLYRTPSFIFQPGTDQVVGYDAIGAPIIERDLGEFDYSASAGALVPELFSSSASGTALYTSRLVPTAQDQARFVSSLSSANLGPLQPVLESSIGIAAERLRNPSPVQATMNQYNWLMSWYGDAGNEVQRLTIGEYANSQLHPGGFPLNPNSHIFGKIRQEAVIPLSRYQAAARQVQAHLDQDVAMLEAYNESMREQNERVGGVLGAATGQSLAPNRKPWADWWVDQLGYRSNQRVSQLRPTYFEDTVTAYIPPVAGVASQVLTFNRVSCFGAGTMVKTLDGYRPIEAIAVGDRVLSQDPATGVLSYQTVLVVHHNPPSETLKVKLGDEAIVASTFHRFWVAGRGWKMLRELKSGDPIRILDGREVVSAVEPDKVQPVFNLDVAGGHTFFVGRRGALVHDNGVPGTRDAVFDAMEPSLAVASGDRP